MEFLNDIWVFLTNVMWGRVAVVVIFTLVAVVLGIWFPAKMLEQHTNPRTGHHLVCPRRL